MIPGLTKMMGTVKPAPKVVTWTGNAFDINLRATYNAWGYTLVPFDTVLFVINPGVYIGASSTGAWACQLGGWGDMPVGATLNMIIYGRIQGAGGKGGGFQGDGEGGGPCMYVDRQINLVTNGAQIFAGGGGGGRAIWAYNGQLSEAGGGGCGYNPGLAGDQYPYSPSEPWWHPALDGTTESGGTGFRADNNGAIGGGDGGGPGAPGGSAFGDNAGYEYYFPGGPTNWAVYGWGNCTFGNWDFTKQEFVYTGAHNADIRGNLA